MESPLFQRIHAVVTLLLFVGLVWQTYALSTLRAGLDGVGAEVAPVVQPSAAAGEARMPAKRPMRPRGLPGRIKPMDASTPGGAGEVQQVPASHEEAPRMDGAVARALSQRKMARLEADKERLMVRSTARVESIVDSLITDGVLDDAHRAEVEDLMLDGVNEIWMLKGDVARGDLSDADARAEVESVRSDYLGELAEFVGEEAAENMFNQMMGVSSPVR